MAKNDDWKQQVPKDINYDTNSLIEAYREVAINTDNGDRRDAALASMSELIQRREDWLRSQPTAQVERLMAAGMSRAQALATLQSTGESQPVQTPIAGNTEQADIERMNAITNTIAMSFQLLEGVVQTGVQLGLAIPTIRTQVQQAKIAKFQSDQMQIATSTARLDFDALTDVGNFLQGMQNYQDRTGQQLPADLNAALKAMQAVAYEDMPDVYSLSHDRLQKAMENPRFYPALRKAHSEFSKGNYELGLEMQQQRADLNISRYKPDVMFSEIARNWQDVYTAEETLNPTIEEMRSRANLQSSQANLFNQEGRIKKIDADFWTTAGGHNRRALLINETSQQFYLSRLQELGVQYNEAFNETAMVELWNDLQIAKNLGPDYFDKRSKELMQNVEYRNAVLQAGLYAMTKREDSQGKWYADMFDWLTAYGVLGDAIDATEGLAGSFVMGNAIKSGHMLHGKGLVNP